MIPAQLINGVPYVAAADAEAAMSRQRKLIADLVEALDGMCVMWRSVCLSHGWEPGHVVQHVKASMALNRAKEQK